MEGTENDHKWRRREAGSKVEVIDWELAEGKVGETS